VLSSGRVVNQDGIPDELCTEAAHAQFHGLIVELNNAIFNAGLFA
jgi:hypothetical protein